MTGPRRHAQLRKALEDSLEVLGEPSKKSLLAYLEKECGISLDDEALTLEGVEGALKMIFGRGAGIITDEIAKSLRRQGHGQRRRSNPVNRHDKSLA